MTPEQYQPLGPIVRDGRRVPWSACQTLNGRWGYDRDNPAYMSPDVLIRLLVGRSPKYGNLLLNVGPTGRGQLDPRAIGILHEVGERMSLGERSIRGCGASEFSAPADCRC